VEIDVPCKWVFADSFQKGNLQFVEMKKEKWGNVMYFLGEIDSVADDWRIFPNKISNLKDLVKALGKDETAWKSKIFSVYPTADKKKVVLTPL
jgi:hypothetical protein